MGKFTELEVWKLSKALAVDMINISSNGKLSKNYGLKDQMQRAAISIPSNIAEGEESGSIQNSIRYFRIAKGSSAELRTQLIISKETGLITPDEFNNLYKSSEIISSKLERLIQARQRRIKP